MDGQRFLIDGQPYDAGDPQLQEVLARLHARSDAGRPQCLCVPDGVEMYVARHRQYIVKRMPGTGARHHPACPSFEPDMGQSGLGELLGEAIVETAPGVVELRVDFSLSRVLHPGVPRGEPRDPGEVGEPRRRMSLRALTHFLFERAGFNRCSPGMAGKRNQAVLEKYLLAAADEMIVKGHPLSGRLYVPGPFSESTMAEAARRRREKFAVLHPKDGQAPLALLLGEFRHCETTVTGRRVWIRHMPDMPILASKQIWERLERTYARYFEAKDVGAGFRPRLVMTALIRARREFTYEIDTASLMLASAHWVPVDGIDELALVQALVAEKRRFLKPLRYDARNAAAFANVLLLDAGPEPVQLHIVSRFMRDAERKAKESAIAATGKGVWVWYTDEALPAFP
jgi:hypothetical protein